MLQLVFGRMFTGRPLLDGEGHGVPLDKLLHNDPFGGLFSFPFGKKRNDFGVDNEKRIHDKHTIVHCLHSYLAN